jgi:TRAP transporter 4TM/12TM fusion protein
MRVKMAEQVKDDSGMRTMGKWWCWVVGVIGVFFSFYYVYTSGFGLLSLETHLGIYLGCTLMLCFLLYPAFKRSPRTRPSYLDILLTVMSTLTVGYWIIEWPTYAYRIGNPTDLDILVGSVLIILVIEVARRVLGKILPILAILFIFYALFGRYLSGLLAHKGFIMVRTIEFLACGTGSIYGVVTNTYATFVFPFIVFAAFLQVSGSGKAIQNLAMAIAGKTAGGPAKIAVVASGIMGSVTGSSAANVVATGSYTIPLMKRSGYQPHVAGAVEAAASTGGQMLPPVMGAAAFLVAAFTETAYVEICKIAAIPAIIYFITVGMMVHFEAGREGLKGLSREELPNLKEALKQSGLVLIPILVIMILLIYGYSANRAAFGAILSSFLLSLLKKETRMGPQKIAEAFILGAKNSLVVGATAGVVGIIVGVTSQTGLGIKFSSIVLSFSGGNLLLAIMLTGIGAYILGMGMTVTAAYVILAVLAVPALMELGVPLIPAHLVVFWFSQTSQITPPVALAVFAASGIARSDPNKTGFCAVKMGSALFIAPFLFIYTPILFSGSIGQVVQAALSSVLAFIAFAGTVQGYWVRRLNILERISLAIASVLLFVNPLWMNILGLIPLIGLTLYQKLSKPRTYVEAVK